MNTLFSRGFDRSRCLWRATSKVSTPSAASLTRPEPLMCLPAQRALYPSTTTSTRAFSSIEPEKARRPPSAIEKSNLPNLTPGHAIRILQIHAAKAQQLIRTSDFHRLCNSSRPGKKRDAKVIARAMMDFKRCNKFILKTEGARMAIQGMMRSMVPNYKVVYGRPRVEASVFTLGTILDERTGLYFAVEPFMVDKVLSDLYKGLVEMEERGANLRFQDAGEENEGEEIGEEEKMLRDAARVTDGVIKLLVKRRCRPENDMKKRAKRKYLKYLQLNDGPELSTMTLAAKICLATGGPDYTRKNIVDPYTDAWWTRGNIDDSITQMVADAEAKDAEAKKLAEAVAAEEADEGEAEEDADAQEGEAKEDETEESK